MSEPRSDRALWEASRAGDHDAFVDLVERHEAAVCAITFAMTGTQSRSEELAQDTFLAAWQQLDTVREPDRLAPWLCAIARNLARKSLRRRPPAELVDPDRVPSPQDGPEESAAAREEIALVWEALRAMPLRYREPLVLYYRQGRSARQVAEALGLEVATVDQRLSRGRRMLREDVERTIEPALVRSDPGDRVRRRVAALVVAIPLRGTAPKGTSKTASATAGASVGLIAGLLVAVVIVLLAIVNLSSLRGDAEAADAGSANAADDAGPPVAASVAPGIWHQRQRARDDDGHRAARGGGEDDAAEEDAPLPHYVLSRLGDSVTVNLGGGESRTVVFRRGGTSMTFAAPTPDTTEESIAKHEENIEKYRAARPDKPTKTRQITGRVVTRAGTPVDGAVILAGGVEFDRASVEAHAIASHGTTSGVDGRFAVDVAVDSTATLIALSESGWSASHSVSAASDDADVELVVTGGSRLTGHVVREGAGVPALLRLGDTDSEMAYSVLAEVDGSFAVDPIAPGTYQVRATPMDDDATTGSARLVAEVVISEGKDATLDIELHGGVIVVEVDAPSGVSKGWLLLELVRGTHDISEPAQLTALVDGPVEPGQEPGRATQLSRGGDEEALEQPIELADLDAGPYTACARLMTTYEVEVAADGKPGLTTDDLAFGCRPVTLASASELATVAIPLVANPSDD